MKMTRNKKLGVAYVEVRKGKATKTLEPCPGVLLDLDSKGKLLGIELIDLPEEKPAPKRKKKTRKKTAA